ncbi:MAG: hypothetical protein GX421_00830 [Caldisericales bacterium]|nr:hypothetical protein [Caldisericales bacterium]
MKKALALIVAVAVLAGLPVIMARNTAASDVKITVEQIYGVMPESYIGSFNLSGPNTVESDYSVGYYYPMCAMKVTSGGDLIVADTAYGRIHVLDSDLSHKSVFGSLGFGDGKFQYPVDCAEDGDGNLYFVDMYNCQVSKWDKYGKFLGAFGTEGQENGQFVAPGGIAVDADGNIYVSDGHTARIQRFDSAFKFKNLLNVGTDTVALDSPGPIRVGPNGEVFVAEMKSGTIFQFKPSGDFVKAAVKSPDGKTPIFTKMGAFEVDANGTFYILDRANGSNAVKVFDKDGKEKATFQNVASDDEFLDGIAISPNNVYVHVYGSINPGSGPMIDNPFIVPSSQRLIKFDKAGSKKGEESYNPMQEGRGGNITSCAVTSNGTLYAVSNINVAQGGKYTSKILIWDAKGSFQNSISTDDLSLPSQALFSDVAVDSYDNVYVSVNEGFRGEVPGYILKIATGSEMLSTPTPDSKAAISYSSEQIGKGDLGTPAGLCVDRMDNLYVADRAKQSVIIFTSKGRKRDELGVNTSPSNVSVDPFRNIACATDGQIVVIDKKGRDVASMGGQGRKPGQLYYPHGVLFANNGAVIVSDAENGRIQIFERKEGSDFAVTYTSPRMFYIPQGMCWGKDQKVYLADNFHNVVYRLNINGYTPPGIGESGPEPPLPPQPPAPQNIPSDGEIYFQPSDIKIPSGGSTDVNISIKYASNVYGVGMTLKYDPQYLQLDKCEQGNFLSSDGNKNLFIYKDEPKGTVKIGGPTRTSAVAGMNGEGILIKVRFTGVKEGDTKLEVSEVLVKDPDLNNIQVSVTNAKVKVMPKDGTPPPVNFTAPKCSWDASFTGSGTTEKDAKLTLKTIDGTQDIKVGADGSFKFTINLKKGANSFTITATDPAGNSKDYTFTVNQATRNVVVMWVGKLVYMVNGSNMNLNAAPQLIGGSTYVPMRDLGNALSCVVDWDAKEKKATYTYTDPCSGSQTVLEAWIDKTMGRLNGNPLDFGKAPKIIGGRTLVPLRAISSGLGADVKYEASSKQITITHPKP